MRPLRDDVGRPVAAIDAVAGRGGEAPGRRRGASAGPPRADARRERAREAAAGDAELPPEDDAVEMASAVHVLAWWDIKESECGVCCSQLCFFSHRAL